MNISNQERIKNDLENISQVEFKRVSNNLSNKTNPFLEEIQKQFSIYEIVRLEVSSEQKLNMGVLSVELFLNGILNNSTFKKAIIELGPREEKIELDGKIQMASSLYKLLGDLCYCLQFGGAYTDGTSLKPDVLVKVVKDFIDDFLPEGYKNYHYFQFFDPWAEWFAGVAWDYTFLLINHNGTDARMLCITDSD